MTDNDLKVYTAAAELGFFDVDVKLRASPVAYWRLLQNAAASHARVLSAATELLRQRGQTWMLSKMKLQVRRHLLLGDGARIETWPSTKLKGARAYRDFVLKDGEGKICAAASSLWVIVDLASRRPQRIPDAIAALRHDPGYEIPPLDENSLGVPNGAGGETKFRAEWSDCDQNEHVNNVSILRWAVDASPLEILEGRELAEVEVHYRNELRLHENVAVFTERSGDLVRQLISKADGSEVAVIHSRWRESR